ncbi:MAG: DUF2061 domain-containing protein [Asticcacaulis sp.]
MRTTLKTGTYAVMHLCVAVTVTYAITGNWKAALAIGLIEPFVQTFAYMGHEKVWARFGGERHAKDSTAPMGCPHGV